MAAFSFAQDTGITDSQAQSNAELFYQLQTLQEEVMQLRDLVEQQAHELRQMKQESMERYIDIDRRLSGAPSAMPGAIVDPAMGAVTDSPVPGANGATPAAENPATTVAGATTAAPTPDMPSELEAYRAAYSLVKDKRYDEAITAFRGFLGSYGGSQYIPNAHYWLGAIYMLNQELDTAQKHFSDLLAQFPDHQKVPDAMFKLAKLHFDRGNRIEARRLLDKIVSDYGDTGSAASRLARKFINDNY